MPKNATLPKAAYPAYPPMKFQPCAISARQRTVVAVSSLYEETNRGTKRRIARTTAGTAKRAALAILGERPAGDALRPDDQQDDQQREGHRLRQLRQARGHEDIDHRIDGRADQHVDDVAQ